MTLRGALGASIVTAMLVTGCSAEDDSVATLEPPATLGELDDVVITVAAEDLAGERIRLEDIDGDGEVEIVPPEQSAREEVAPEQRPPEQRPPEASAPGESAPEPSAAEDGRMPDVVCLGLQDAQDEIQDRGVFFSRSEDATGDGRRQIWDRNWIVVAQDPEPGGVIGENEAILYVVKNGEDNDC